MPDEPENLEIANSEDDIDEFIRNLLADDPDLAPTADTESEGTAEVDETPPSTPNESLTWRFDDGLEIDREKARNLALFDAWLEANPQLASQIAGVAQGQYELVPKSGRGVQPDGPTSTLPPATPAYPDDFDADDPVQKRLWQELQSTRDQIAAASEVIQRHEAQIQQTGVSTTRALVERVSSEYAAKKNLDADEIALLRRTAANLNIVSSLASPFDPVSGLPRQVDPVAAVEQALDTAYWATPEFRSRALEEMTKQQISDIRRKARLNSLGGTSGSVPRKVAKPTNEQERREAMIAEVAAAWNGNGN